MSTLKPRGSIGHNSNNISGDPDGVYASSSDRTNILVDNNNNSNNNNGDDDDTNEKEAKVQRSNTRQFRHLLIFILLLSVAALFVGYKEHETISSNGRNYSNSNSRPINKPKEILLEPPPLTLDQLVHRVEDLDGKVRMHKAQKDVLMEKDSTGLKLTKELQHYTHQLLVKRYGRHAKPFRVRVDLQFPKSVPDYSAQTSQQSLYIEMAPYDLIPCSVYHFLEIARTYQSGAFHRNAGHVLQVQVHAGLKKSMPFQEYSPEYPHRTGTTGYAGRPSGPAWYVSTRDNTQNHGPGSQQKHNPYEADSLFGKIVEGGMETIVPRIHSIPQHGWLDQHNQVAITKMTILIPDPQNKHEWVPWQAKEL